MNRPKHRKLRTNFLKKYERGMNECERASNGTRMHTRAMNRPQTKYGYGWAPNKHRKATNRTQKNAKEL